MFDKMGIFGLQKCAIRTICVTVSLSYTQAGTMQYVLFYGAEHDHYNILAKNNVDLEETHISRLRVMIESVAKVTNDIVEQIKFLEHNTDQDMNVQDVKKNLAEKQLLFMTFVGSVCDEY